MKRCILGLIAITAMFASSQAAALTITYGGVADAASGQTTGQAGAIVETFDGAETGGFVQPWTWSHSDALPNIVTGNLVNQYAAPFGNSTYYYSVAKTVPGWAQVNLSETYNYLGLYWGSVDTYNTIILTNTVTNETVTILGSTVLAGAGLTAGNQGAEGSQYVNIFTDFWFNQARFESSQFAFEFDNLAVAKVPEPGTLGLIGAGLAGLGLIARRKRNRQ